jgi:hypothetical protein
MRRQFETIKNILALVGLYEILARILPLRECLSLWSFGVKVYAACAFNLH